MLILRSIIGSWIKRVYFSRKGLNPNLILSTGFPDIQVRDNGKLVHNGLIMMVNTAKASTLGNPRRCKFLVFPDAVLHFKGKCYMSNTVIVATKRIVIGNNVMIGGGVTIVDSDFHSLDYNDWGTWRDLQRKRSEEVVIGDNVFIGMEALILKGVHIGNGCVIGARTVVTKDIPSYSVVAGNPCRVIKILRASS